MSDTRRDDATTWPDVTRLREQFAAGVRRTADEWQAETGCSDEEIVRYLKVAIVNTVSEIAESLIAAGEMALDVWECTR